MPIKKYEYGTILGLDLGIASVGWCLLQKDKEGNPCRIIDKGSFVFDQIENGKDGKTENIARREKRLMRRQHRRKKLRLADGRKLFEDTFHVAYDGGLASAYDDPFSLKVKGLSERLKPEELMIALYHYLKYRGFKSNRKSQKEKDDSKMLDATKKNEDKLQQLSAALDRPVYITELLLGLQEDGSYKEKEVGKPIHNRAGEFNFTVARADYEEEIKALLDKQLEYGVINGDFKDKFLTLFKRQRDFSDGPAEPSKYHVDFNAVRGKCFFDGKPRAPKDSYSAKAFVLLSALNNLSFKLVDEEGGVTPGWQHLTAEEIDKGFAYCIARDKTTYGDLLKHLKKDVFQVKSLDISKKKRDEIYNKFLEGKSKENGGIKPNKLDPKWYEEFDDVLNKEKYITSFFKNSKLVVTLLKEKELKNIFSNPDFIDAVAELLFLYKTNERITKEFKENQTLNFSQDIRSNSKILKKILELEGSVDKTINLSIDVCKKIMPYMLKGSTYDKAMKEAGFNHSALLKNEGGVSNGLPEIDSALSVMGINLCNPVVRHSLVKMRKVINAIVKTYGLPTDFSIELAREMKRNFQDRRALRSNQMDRQYDNIKIKNEIREKYGSSVERFRGRDIPNYDVVKYKLFKEQNGISPYSNKPINENHLFDKNYEVDHILPQSRSFDDSFNNKVLVETSLNKNKGNKTPYEYGGALYEAVKQYTATNHPDRRKAANLLNKSFEKEKGEEFLNKDFEDSSYLARVAKDLITFYLLPPGKQCKSISGAMTDKLRKIWNLSGCTHSYLSSAEACYKAKDIQKYIYKSISSDDKSITIIFEYKGNNDGNGVYELPIVIEKKKLSEDEKATFDLFINNFEYARTKFQTAQVQTIDGLYSACDSLRPDLNTQVRDAMWFILGKARQELQNDVNTKDRRNHLHHALDAAVIACITPALAKRLSDFYKDNEEEIDPETGEIKLSQAQIPLPYPEFAKEVRYHIYERDIDKLISRLNELDNYKQEPATKETVHVLYPVREQKKDIKGPISKETIYGVKTIHENGEEIIVLTNSISTQKLTIKDLENIVDKDGGNSVVYKSCKEWLKAGKPTAYPILKKKNVPIKKVVLKEMGSLEEKVHLKGGWYADNDTVVRVNVYKKKNGDGRLFFAPVYYIQIWRENVSAKGQKVELPSYTIMCGSGENDILVVSSYELKNSYVKVCSLNRYSLIEVETKNGGHGIVYTGGATKGQFEVYSILGDNHDLVHYGLFNKTDSRQNRFTVSQIKSIKLRNISILGKLS